MFHNFLPKNPRIFATCNQVLALMSSMGIPVGGSPAKSAEKSVDEFQMEEIIDQGAFALSFSFTILTDQVH